MSCSNSFLVWHLTWDKGTSDQKYTRPKEMEALTLQFAEALYKAYGRQAFVLWLDSRFPKVETLDKLKEQFGFHGVFALGGGRRPQDLWPWLKSGLQKKEWRVVWRFPTTGQRWERSVPNAFLVFLRCKNTAFLKLVGNFSDLFPEVIMQRRRKFPAGRYEIVTPNVQVLYNKYKCALDLWNRMQLAYQRLTRDSLEDDFYNRFCYHALTTQACLSFKLRPGFESFRGKRFRYLVTGGLQLIVKGEPVPAPLPPVSDGFPQVLHWPRPLDKVSANCAASGCKCKARVYCARCPNSHMCHKHLRELHVQLERRVYSLSFRSDSQLS